MNKPIQRFFCALICLFCLNTESLATPVKQGQSKANKGVILKGNISQLINLCSYAGITLDGDSLPSTITKIRLGSPASYYGVNERDRVQSASLDNNLLKLGLVRNGNRLEISLPVSAQALRQSTSKVSDAKNSIDRFMDEMPEPVAVPSQIATKMLLEEKAQLERFQKLCVEAGQHLPPPMKASAFKDVRALGGYDIVLILDCSGSMAGKLGYSYGESKWKWAQTQMYGMSSELEQALKKGAMLIPFTDKYQVYQPCFASDVQNIFLQRQPSGGTNLFPPLEDVLSRKVVSKRPMFICIFTDGGFGYKQEIRDLIVSATSGIAGPFDLRINFLILEDKQLSPEIAALENLTMAGAKYDVVKIMDINQLDKKGFKQAIVDSVSQP